LYGGEPRKISYERGSYIGKGNKRSGGVAATIEWPRPSTGKKVFFKERGYSVKVLGKEKTLELEGGSTKGMIERAALLRGESPLSSRGAPGGMGFNITLAVHEWRVFSMPKEGLCKKRGKGKGWGKKIRRSEEKGKSNRRGGGRSERRTVS